MRIMERSNLSDANFKKRLGDGFCIPPRRQESGSWVEGGSWRKEKEEEGVEVFGEASVSSSVRERKEKGLKGVEGGGKAKDVDVRMFHRVGFKSLSSSSTRSRRWFPVHHRILHVAPSWNQIPFYTLFFPRRLGNSSP